MRLQRYAETIVRYAWVIMALILVATVLLGRQALQLQTRFDRDASFPPGDPFVLLDQEIRREFGGRNFVIMAVVPKQGDVWQASVLTTVSELTDAVRLLPNVIGKDVISLSSPNVRRVEDSDWGIKQDYLMREAPTTPEGIAGLRAIYEATPIYHGVVVSDDQRAALVLADFWDDATSEEIHHEIATIADRFDNDEIDIFFSGEPIIAAAEFAYIRNMPSTMAWTFALIMIVLFLSFRSVQGMLLPMITAALSTIWGLGWIQLAGIPLGIWNSAVPILTIAVAASHSAQMLKRYYEELARGCSNQDAVLMATTRMGPVMIAAGGTAALGFASLAVFRIPSMSHFGLSAAYGIGSAVVLEMTFIPALRSRLRPRGVAPVASAVGNRVLNALAATLQHRPLFVGVLFAALVTLALGGIAQLRTGRPSRDYVPDGPPRAHLDAITEHFPGTITFTVLFEGASDMAKEPAVLDGMFRLQRELELDPNVVRTASIADLIAYVNQIFNPHADGGIPNDRKLVAQLLFLSQSAAYDRFVDRSFGRGVVSAYLRTDDTHSVARLVSLVNEFAARNRMDGKARIRAAGGVGPLMFALDRHATRGKLLNVLVVLFAIYTISSLVLRTPLGGLFVVCPLVITALVNLGILGWTVTPLDMVTASTLAAGIGIGADYSIYLLYRLREEHARIEDEQLALQATLHTSGRAVIFVAVAIAFGFLPLALSSHPAFRISGTLTPLTMLVSCATALTLIPALVFLTRPAFVFDRTFRGTSALAREIRL